MKHKTRLYNVFFPLWMLLFFPVIVRQVYFSAFVHNVEDTVTTDDLPVVFTAASAKLAILALALISSVIVPFPPGLLDEPFPFPPFVELLLF